MGDKSPKQKQRKAQQEKKTKDQKHRRAADAVAAKVVVTGAKK